MSPRTKKVRVEAPKRGRGRPRVDPASETQVLTVRVSPAHIEELDAIAAELDHGVTRSDAVRMLIARSAQERGR